MHYSAGTCPRCGGRVLVKKSKAGRVYYGCEFNTASSEAQKCEFMTWDEPIADRCPKCGKTLFKSRGKNGRILCAAEGCGFEKALD